VLGHNPKATVAISRGIIKKNSLLSKSPRASLDPGLTSVITGWLKNGL
jgi:ABC-type arginine transport system ATPase subunit